MSGYRAALSSRVALVSVMWANNETGVIFPVEALAEEAKAVGAVFHTDAVQAAGRAPINLKRSAIDLLSLSAHKLHGPKGVGALYVRRGLKFAPMIHGGRQERARRGGTENVPGIVGFGKAAEIAVPRLHGDAARMRALRDRLESDLVGRIRDVVVMGARAERLPNTSAIACAGAEAEAVATMLAREDIAVSTGAACSAGSHAPSHVLKAMNAPIAARAGRSALLPLARNRRRRHRPRRGRDARNRRTVAGEAAGHVGPQCRRNDVRRPMRDAPQIRAVSSRLAQRHDAARRRANAGRRLHPWPKRSRSPRRSPRPAFPSSRPELRRWGRRRSRRSAPFRRCDLGVRVLAWCRMGKADIDAARKAGVGAVNLSIPASDRLLSVKLGLDRAEALERVRRYVPMALDAGFEVAVGAEDASRADPDHLMRLAETAAEAGAFRLRLADTVGLLDPFRTHDLVAPIVRATDLAVEFHGHDDYGMATANTLAAIRAGATHASVTVVGLGERAGNALPGGSRRGAGKPAWRRDRARSQAPAGPRGAGRTRVRSCGA